MKIAGASALIIRINVKLQRITTELGKIERNRSRLQEISGREDLSEIITSETALSIHNVYNGIEQILEDVARDLDGGLPGGDASHSDLLDQLGSETPLRPPVIPGDIIEIVRDLMRFRHFFRHSYGVDFRTPDVEAKYDALTKMVIPGIFSSLQSLSEHLDGPDKPDTPKSGIDDGPP